MSLSSARDWPKSPRKLADELKRHKKALAVAGIEVSFDPQRHNDGYHVTINRIKPPLERVD